MIKELENKTHTFIEGTNNEYTITTEGEVWSHKSNKFIITKYDDDKNCITAQIHIPNKKRKIKIHLEVARHFIPNPNNYKFVRFIDNNKYNCNVENLYWSEFIIDIKIKPEKNIIIKPKVIKEKFLKEVKNINDIEKKENELFVNFNHEIYNHYLISNYGRIFNSKSGNMIGYKSTHDFVNGNKENTISINKIVFKHFYYDNIYIEKPIKNYPDEEFKTMDTENTTYLISNYGDIYSCNSSKIIKLKPLIDTDGYLSFNLKPKSIRIHRAVGLYFLLPIDEKTLINHKDGNRWNNYYKNLEYVNNEENSLHAMNILKTINYQKKSLLQLNENKEIVNEFESITNGSIFIGGKNSKQKLSSIAQIFNKHKHLKKYKGFYWVFKEDYNKLKSKDF